MITTNLVLAEVHRFVLFRDGPRAAAAVLSRIEASPRVSIEFATSRHHRAAIAWLGRLSAQRVSYTDAVSFAVMESMRCREAFTFDDDFVVAGFQRWEPS
jgi:predicted nucleic acid-binding protein